MEEYTVRSGNDLTRAINQINASREAGDYTIILAANMRASGLVLSNTEAKKTIVIRGDTVLRSIINTKNEILFIVENGVTLVLGNNAALTGNGKKYKATQIQVNEGGTLVMKNGSVIEKALLGVYVDSGMFIMEGGAIRENELGVDCVAEGVFKMTGGEISGNKGAPYFGSGVRVYCDAVFTMEAGEIHGNEAEDGGGVWSADEGLFKMSGGKISGNKASNDGGGVAVSAGGFIMTGGEISGNTACNEGGGVCVDCGTFKMSGGEISGNTATNGGGACVWRCVFTKTGGTISDTNEAEKGKAVYMTMYDDMDDPPRQRNSAARPDVNMDIDKDGAAGGWE
jgi:hypothetical protein